MNETKGTFYFLLPLFKLVAVRLVAADTSRLRFSFLLQCDTRPELVTPCPEPLRKKTCVSVCVPNLSSAPHASSSALFLTSSPSDTPVVTTRTHVPAQSFLRLRSPLATFAAQSRPPGASGYCHCRSLQTSCAIMSTHVDVY